MSYEVLESKVTHKGFLVTVTMDKIQMPDGTTAMRESVIRGKNAAAVLPVDNDGSIIFVRQYRHAFAEMILEIPAGIMHDDEDPAVGILS
ncbi:MAG: NUDIX hydrolase, partial [Anaerotignum sp.]|nr:NUDIX hydrolase [Anaerotignum sp.]